MKMTHPSKIKGNTFERECVNIAKEAGLRAIRAYGSNGRSLGLEEEVDALIGSYKAQCKRRARIAKWIKPPECCDLAIVREDYGKAYVIMEYEDWLKLLTCGKYHKL
jgi:hypothetical protein|tara:strand:+ start:1311 stop:1631 length:321 start_codon:yes stop_codon:yes gene_type:complete